MDIPHTTHIHTEKCFRLGITNPSEIAILEVLTSRLEMIGETKAVIQIAAKKLDHYLNEKTLAEVRAAASALESKGFLNLIVRPNRKLLSVNKTLWDRELSIESDLLGRKNNLKQAAPRMQTKHETLNSYGLGKSSVSAPLRKGDFVSNPKAPEWGIGEVIESSGKYVEIIFSEERKVKTFLREKNNLARIDKPDFQELKILTKNKLTAPHKKHDFDKAVGSSEMIKNRVKRDSQNAQYAIEMAETKLKSFSVITERPDITRGFSRGYLTANAASAREFAGLEVIAANPFHAMMEVETEVRGKHGKNSVRKQLWYANEHCPCNLPLDDGEKKVNILAWTHPGVQLALVESLGEKQDIRSSGYNLAVVAPLARAKFWQLFPDIAGIYDPGGHIRGKKKEISQRGLRAVKLDMSRDQVKAFISKMNGMMLVRGAPGSGKTTVAMQRIRFLYDQQELRKENLRNVEYSPELTRIFLANQNLIDFSKDMLSKDLDIPSRIVELVPRFVNTYLNEIWTYKHHARSRRKKLFFYDKRGRQAFFGLCNATQLENCWSTFELQISERLAQAGDAGWLNISDRYPEKKSTVRKKITNWFNRPEKPSFAEASDSLVAALVQSSKKEKVSIPASSQYKMDSIYTNVGKFYEELRNRCKAEGNVEKFDLEFKQWLFWVYDPLDAIISNFQENFYEGGIRIRNGIAAKMAENEILNNIRTEWKDRKYGDEQAAWLAFLLRFVLPTQGNPHERFRDMPNPLAVDENLTRWTHVMIDEAQDLNVAEAALLSSFVHPDGAFTVSADFHQVVSPVWGMENPDAFRIGSSLRDKGAFMTYRFAKNMRQSKQIGMFLQAFYQNIFGELAPFECNDTIEGAIPLLLLCSYSDFALRIMQRVAVLKRNPNIASIAFLQIDEDQKAMEQMRDSLQKQGLELAPIWSASDDGNRIITTSVERIKGLEYDACFVVGMDNMENSALKHSKNRAYVALSRPARQLTIFCEDIPNSLQKIDKDLLETLRV